MNDPQWAFAERLAEMRRQEMFAAAEKRRQLAQLRRNEADAPDGQAVRPGLDSPVRSWPLRSILLGFFVRFRHGG